MIKLPDFIIIPYPLLEDKNITLIDERLYGIIYWFTRLKNEKCTASNTTLAELIKSTPRSVQNSLNLLEKKGFIKRHFKDKKSRHRTEIEALISYARPFVPYEPPCVPLRTMGDSPLRTMGDQNKNIDNKNNKEDKSVAQNATTPSQESENFFKNEDMQKKAIDYLTTKGFNQNYIQTEIKKFISYWTEPTRSGKKQRWETEKTYDVRRRLATWLNNSNKFNRSTLSTTKRGIEI